MNNNRCVMGAKTRGLNWLKQIKNGTKAKDFLAIYN